jgi:hypothetical protein
MRCSLNQRPHNNAFQGAATAALPLQRRCRCCGPLNAGVDPRPNVCLGCSLLSNGSFRHFRRLTAYGRSKTLAKDGFRQSHQHMCRLVQS